MISVSLLGDLYDYNYWARDRQLEACAALTDEQFVRPMGNSFPSVRDTLAHLVGAEWVWLERWHGRSPRALPPGSDFTTLGAIEKRWREVERDVRAYLATLTEQALLRPLEYVNLKGEPFTYPLWQTLVHVVNHQTYHRGQITTLLRQLGTVAVPIDYLDMVDARVS